MGKTLSCKTLPMSLINPTNHVHAKKNNSLQEISAWDYLTDSNSSFVKETILWNASSNSVNNIY